MYVHGAYFGVLRNPNFSMDLQGEESDWFVGFYKRSPFSTAIQPQSLMNKYEMNGNLNRSVTFTNLTTEMDF